MGADRGGDLQSRRERQVGNWDIEVKHSRSGEANT